MSSLSEKVVRKDLCKAMNMNRGDLRSCNAVMTRKQFFYSLNHLVYTSLDYGSGSLTFFCLFLLSITQYFLSVQMQPNVSIWFH